MFPKIIEVYCWFNDWYISQYVYVSNKKVNIKMSLTPCGMMYMTMRYNEKGNCPQGNCIVISNINFKIVERKLQFVKCDDSEEGTESQKFYQEPA